MRERAPYEPPIIELMQNPYSWGFMAFMALVFLLMWLRHRYDAGVREEWSQGKRALYNQGFDGWLFQGCLAVAGLLLSLTVGGGLIAFGAWYVGCGMLQMCS